MPNRAHPRPTASPAVIYADGDDGLRRYLHLVDEQVEWGGLDEALRFAAMKQAAVMFVAVGLDGQPRFGITPMCQEVAR